MRDDLELASHLRLVITRTARRLRQQASTELSPTLLSALATLGRSGPLTPSDLASIERVQRPTATRVAARLEEQGLITRTADPSDGRGSLLTLSPEGRVLLKKLRKRKNAYLARQLRGLDASDAAVLDRAAVILERMLEEEPA